MRAVKFPAMKQYFFCALTLMFVVLLLLPTAAFAAMPKLEEAQSAILISAGGETLYEKDADARYEPASITKIMTAMVALDCVDDYEQILTIHEVDLGWDSQTAGYKKSDKPTFLEVFQVMLVFSANDAAYEIAVAAAGSEEAFVELMNEKARELGMSDTHFENCHGLQEDGHLSSARDLAMMGRYAMEHYPLIVNTVKMRYVTSTVDGEKVEFETTDQLMESYEGLLGIKTGAVEAGTTFLGAAERDGIRFYSVVLGCETVAGRFDDSATLLDWGFDNHERIELLPAQTHRQTMGFVHNFRLACSLGDQTSASGLVAHNPEANPVTFTSHELNPLVLTCPGEVIGMTIWQQGNRPLDVAWYQSQQLIMKPLAVSPFTRPLFEATPRANLVWQRQHAA